MENLTIVSDHKTFSHTIAVVTGYRRERQDLRPHQGHDREDTVAPFPQPFWELLLSFAVAFIPIAVVVWDHQAATEAELQVQAPEEPGG